MACGGGVVAVTAARRGARVRGLDLSPVLIGQARRNADFVGAQIEFIVGDAEALSYADAIFDVVLSQFGHMLASNRRTHPRRRACSSPEAGSRSLPGRRNYLWASSSPSPRDTRSRLRVAHRRRRPGAIRSWSASCWAMRSPIWSSIATRFTPPALSPQHYRAGVEQTIAPVATVVATSAEDPQRLAALRQNSMRSIKKWFHHNRVRQSFLMTRALKR